MEDLYIYKNYSLKTMRWHSICILQETLPLFRLHLYIEPCLKNYITYSLHFNLRTNQKYITCMFKELIKTK